MQKSIFVNKHFLKLLLLTTNIICLVSIYCSVYPGLLEFRLIFTLLLLALWLNEYEKLIFIFIVGSIGFLTWKLENWINRRKANHRQESIAHDRFYNHRLATFTAAIVIFTTISIWTQLPLKMAFSLSRVEFESFIDSSDRVTNFCNTSDEELVIPAEVVILGWYRIDSCDSDERGNIYFQTYSNDFFDPTEFQGFAYKPSPTTPDLSRSCEFTHIVDRWYVFKSGIDRCHQKKS